MAKRIGADKERLARTLDEAVGAQLTELRRSRGWSQAQLAESVGYDESYIRQLETGSKSPTLRTLADMARALSIEVSVLIRRAERLMRSKK